MLFWTLLCSGISVSHTETLCVFLSLCYVYAGINAGLVLQIPNWAREQSNVFLRWIAAVAQATASAYAMKLNEIVTKVFICSSWQLFAEIQVLSVKSLLLMNPEKRDYFTHIILWKTENHSHRSTAH